MNTCKDALKVGFGILKKVGGGGSGGGGGGGGGKEGVNDRDQRKCDEDKTTTIDGVLRTFTPIISQRDSGSFVKSQLVNQGSNSSIDIDIAITSTNTTIETNINNDDSIQTSIDDTPIRSISTPPVSKRPVSQNDKDDIVVVVVETPIGESYGPPPPVPTRPNGWKILKSTSGDDSVTSKQGDIERTTNTVSQSGSSPVQGHQSSQYSFDSQSQRSLTLSSHLDAYPNPSDVEDPTFGLQPSTTTTTTTTRTTSYDDQQGIDNQSRSNGYYEYHISPPQDNYSEQYYHSNDSRSYFIDQSNISSGASTYPSTPITAFGCYDGTYTHEPFNMVNSSSSGFTSTASSMGRSSGDIYNRGYADDSNVWSTRAYDESMSRANEMMVSCAGCHNRHNGEDFAKVCKAYSFIHTTVPRTTQRVITTPPTTHTPRIRININTHGVITTTTLTPPTTVNRSTIRCTTTQSWRPLKPLVILHSKLQIKLDTTLRQRLVTSRPRKRFQINMSCHPPPHRLYIERAAVSTPTLPPIVRLLASRR